MRIRLLFAFLLATAGGLSAAEDLLTEKGLPRLIFNDDSDDLKCSAYPEIHKKLWVPAGERVPLRPIRSLDDLLSYRLATVAQTRTDGLSYCGNFGTRAWELPRTHIAALGEDPLLPVVKFWRKDGRKFFFAMRMNDKHHASFNWDHMWDRFRLTHRDCFLRPPDEAEWRREYLPWINDPVKWDQNDGGGYPATLPAALRNGPRKEANAEALLFDYSKPAVREYYLSTLRQACRRYDLDGADLDWLRYPRYFRDGEVDPAILSAFVQEARAILDESAKVRGHPLRLLVRVPDAPARAKEIGLDVAAWAQAGWIDAIVAGNGFTFGANELPQWAKLAHPHRVAVYGVIERMPHGVSRYGSPETILAAAAVLRARGADGIYLFNYCKTDEHPLLDVMVEPARLAMATKEFFVDTTNYTNGESVTKTPIPLVIPAGDSADLTLFVTDRPAQASQLRLEITAKLAGASSDPTIRINGQLITTPSMSRDRDTYEQIQPKKLGKGEIALVISCTDDKLFNLMKPGENTVNLSTSGKLTVTSLSLLVSPAPRTDR